MDLQERTHRWKEIENVCGFNITTNPGIPYLNMLLRGGSGSHSPGNNFYSFKKNHYIVLITAAILSPVLLMTFFNANVLTHD